MKLCEIGVTGQKIDVFNGGDVPPDGRLLSVAELQQAYRGLLQNLRARPAGSASAEPVPIAPVGGGAVATINLEETAIGSAEASADIDADWITIMAAHAGAGASTVALAVADAAAAAGAVHLVETAHPARSGLVAASRSELGMDSSGAWRRGLRGNVTIDRRAGDRTPDGWPADRAAAVATVVDLGLPSVDNLARLVTSAARCVVVCRANVPGVRLVEQTLDALEEVPVAVAVLGAKRWPGEVTASLGPRLRRLRAAGHVVTVPLDRRIEVTGPTHSPLPKAVFMAGRSLLGLIDAARSGEVTTTVHAPGTKGTTR
ncbi:hypothetical protein [Jatrophihabitans lederbergiae]|uniref:Uncharacterized protein n=1 Tax=Jatrophihabitans lederbergiae TaxID=3075547 RepID=A0ABU2JBH4_9ACTN|nr:hypothetical protein [Jatrophihabitans sp. DSM 44399]MDT0262338.1 hypothetical protein [Jatrophihabitans sp. DSM 44399]